MYYYNIDVLLGKIWDRVFQDGESIVFENSKERVTFLHHQDCCEHVYIESIVGELSDLEGVPLSVAEEVSHSDPEAYESGTWTFYKFAGRGWVDVRWYGSSNGYYSEGVSTVHEYLSEPEQLED